MTSRLSAKPLDRYTDIGELSALVRLAIKRTTGILGIALLLELMYLAFSDRPGAVAFALIGAGSCTMLIVWGSNGMGLPLFPLMAVQNLIIYGVPIAVGHENILQYPASFVLSAGGEVLIFDIAMVLVWSVAMRILHPSLAVSYALQEFNKSGAKGWAKLGFTMIVSSTALQVMAGLNLMDSFYSSLPSGVTSIAYAIVAVMSACGFFLVSMIIGGNEASTVAKAVFWGLLVVNEMLAASDFLLATAAATLVTVAIGVFWSSGRIPWRYLIITMVTLSFLNTGKTTMRERYWGNEDTNATHVTLWQLPAVYAEWIQVSYNAVLENSGENSRASAGETNQANKNQTLLDRIDNLQNLLFVIDATDNDHISFLHGETYSIIPPLLVPRILWPNKPRSHEGQVMLNVHFGRQELNSTFQTYIAWGLLPEAYGKFGPIAGAIYLGAFLGVLFAWVENLTARKLVVSLEGFLSLSLLMNLLNSFEMVASVLVTAIFQSFVIVILASLPFVRRTKNPQREPGIIE